MSPTFLGLTIHPLFHHILPFPNIFLVVREGPSRSSNEGGNEDSGALGGGGVVACGSNGAFGQTNTSKPDREG